MMMPSPRYSMPPTLHTDYYYTSGAKEMHVQHMIKEVKGAQAHNGFELFDKQRQQLAQQKEVNDRLAQQLDQLIKFE